MERLPLGVFSRAGGWAEGPQLSILHCYHSSLSDICTSAWILEQMRGGVPSDLLKLGPGSAISLQDISLREAFYMPAAPTLFGVIDFMQWREDGYQVTTVSMNV